MKAACTTLRVSRRETYRVTAALPGFKTSVTNDVQVGTTAQVRLNLTLEVGTVDSRVEVSVSAAQLMTESSASVGDVLPAQRALDLPLVGNDVLDLVKILPGYRAFPQFDTPGAAVYAVFAGQTSNTVNVTRDGLSVTDGRNNANAFGISTTTNINPELIGEIRLVLAPVDAELGRGNTQIQIQTRGGTNRYTGSAVWNIQNSALNANSWGNNNNDAVVNGVTVWPPTRPDWRNTHDVTLTYGGPIMRNKTFFFASWEQQRSNTRALQTNSVYTDAARQGIFRYWEKWNPDDAASAVPTFPATAHNSHRPRRGLCGESGETDTQSGRHTLHRRAEVLQRVRQHQGQRQSVHAGGLPGRHGSDQRLRRGTRSAQPWIRPVTLRRSSTRCRTRTTSAPGMV